MPPRKTRRTEKDAEDDTRNATATTSTADTANAVPINTTGILGLPVELFSLILSNFDDLRDISDSDVLSNPSSLPASYADRADVLRALAQTSRVLRKVVLPLSWENMEVCIVRKEGGAWYKILGDRLERTSKGLARTPDIARHVRIATVTLTRYSTNTVLPAFAGCLEKLPNLHTLRIMHAHSQMTTPLKAAFEKRSFPQIRTIVLPSCAHNVLRVCPNVTRVTCNEDDGGKLLTAIQAGCKKVEALIGITPYEAIAKRIPKAIPNLREIDIDACESRNSAPDKRAVTVEEIASLKVCKNLTSFVLTVGEPESYTRAGTTPQHITAAKNVLLASSATGKKTLVVKYNAWRQINEYSGRFEVVRTERIDI